MSTLNTLYLGTCTTKNLSESLLLVNAFISEAVNLILVLVFTGQLRAAVLVRPNTCAVARDAEPIHVMCYVEALGVPASFVVLVILGILLASVGIDDVLRFLCVCE